MTDSDSQGSLVTLATRHGACVPPTHVQELLDKCCAKASASVFGGCTMVIGRHQQGHALALNVSGAEVGGGETAYTFRPAPVKEEFLLFMSGTMQVTAASQETMTMMGVRAGV